MRKYISKRVTDIQRKWLDLDYEVITWEQYLNQKGLKAIFEEEKHIKMIDNSLRWTF